MACKINRKAYERLICEDMIWLLKHTPTSIERSHVLDVLKHSAKLLYPESKDETPNQPGEMREYERRGIIR
jgi:hypothetical protein